MTPEKLKEEFQKVYSNFMLGGGGGKEGWDSRASDIAKWWLEKVSAAREEGYKEGYQRGRDDLMHIK